MWRSDTGCCRTRSHRYHSCQPRAKLAVLSCTSHSVAYSEMEAVLAYSTHHWQSQPHMCIDTHRLTQTDHPTGLGACGVVLAWVASALVDINIAVATQRRIVWMCRCSPAHQNTVALKLRYEVVLTHTVRKASHTCALVRMERHSRLHTRLSACGAVLTRAAVALIHIEITVASKTRCVRLQVRCHQPSCRCHCSPAHRTHSRTPQ